MGAAWCRDRARAAHNSKSALDRVIVQICPSTEHRPTASENNNSSSNGTERPKTRLFVSQPVPVHTQHQPISATHALNTSSQWEDASLSVPDSPDESGTPVPPPRKKRQLRLQQEGWKSIPRPPPPQPPEETKKKRRQKTLSTVSLPNYSELSLSVYSEKPAPGHKTPPRNESCVPIAGKSPGGLSSLTVEKIENCVRRCRSFGAFKPEQLKLKSEPRHSSESDDSFDGLDDWDLRVIEHCDAHEGTPPQTMFPPQRVRKTPITEPYAGAMSSSESKVDRREGSSVPDTPNKETDRSLSECRVDRIEQTSYSQNSPKETEGMSSEHQVDRTETARISPEYEVDRIETPSDTSTLDQEQEGSAVKYSDGPGSEIDDRKVLVYDFVSPKKPSADLRLVNGFHETEPPKGLKTPPPTPENTNSKSSDKWAHQDEDQSTHSSLLRLLKEYQTAEGKLEESGAQQVLRGLGLPPTLRESTSRGSSGRSSMTPSLSELEAALSDLLEASASRTGAEDDEDDDIPPISSPVPQSLRVMSPKPFSAFRSSFHPVQTDVGSQQQQETSA